jgi:hypothetical protein
VGNRGRKPWNRVVIRAEKRRNLENPHGKSYASAIPDRRRPLPVIGGWQPETRNSARIAGGGPQLDCGELPCAWASLTADLESSIIRRFFAASIDSISSANSVTLRLFEVYADVSTCFDIVDVQVVVCLVCGEHHH